MNTETKPKRKTAPLKSKKILTPEELYLKVQAKAYYLAEKDNFQKDAVEYWLAAETKVRA